MSGERPAHDIFEDNFDQTAEFGRFDRNLSYYRGLIFYDDFVKKPFGEDVCAVTRYLPDGEAVSHQSTLQQLEPLEGGFNHFVLDGKSLLDLGAGSGRAINEMAALNPKTQYCGIDIRYAKEAPPALEQANANLVGATWFNIPFKDGAFDRVISAYSFPYHLGRTQSSELTDKQLAEKAIREITRVSKEGTLWRGVIWGKTRKIDSWRAESIFPEIMTKYGWEMTTIEDNNSEVFIAKLINQDKSTQATTPQ